MSGKQKFEQDLNVILSRLSQEAEQEVVNKLSVLKDHLVKLQKENVVKINHSIMELVCAKYLIQKAYEVQIEYPLNHILACDLFAIKGYGNLIVEIETGYIPPENALAPLTYTSARLGEQDYKIQQFRRKIRSRCTPALHFTVPKCFFETAKKSN